MRRRSNTLIGVFSLYFVDLSGAAFISFCLGWVSSINGSRLKKPVDKPHVAPAPPPLASETALQSDRWRFWGNHLKAGSRETSPVPHWQRRLMRPCRPGASIDGPLPSATVPIVPPPRSLCRALTGHLTAPSDTVPHLTSNRSSSPGNVHSHPIKRWWIYCLMNSICVLLSLQLALQRCWG